MRRGTGAVAGDPTSVSLSPATTCAAVTTRFLPANQPLPSTPTPHAVPSTLTMRVVAARIDGSRRTPSHGGSVGAFGPMIDGNGSMRASRLSSVRGGSAESSCWTIAERSTSWRNAGPAGREERDRGADPDDREADRAAEQEPSRRVDEPQRR